MTVIKDPITNKKWTSSKSGEFKYSEQTNILISFLKARVPDMTVTNFFIAGRNKKGTIAEVILRIFGLRLG